MKRLGCWILLCGSFAGFSQEQPSQSDYEIYDLFDVSLEDLLDVSMISASQKKQSVLDAPANAYIITADQIRVRGYSNLVDLLEDIPQIEIQRNSNPEVRNVITVRGVSGNEKLLILQNGIRITPASDDYYILGNQFSVTHAERVEVIIGPASALYGADAFAGIVNIITKNRESDNSFANVKSLGGNFSTQEHAFTAGTSNGNTGFMISGLYQRSAEPDYQHIYPQGFAWYNDYYSKYNMVVESPSYSQIWNKQEWERWADASFTGPSLSQQFDMSSRAYYVNAELQLSDFHVGYVHYSERHSTSYGIDPRYTAFDKDAWIEMSQDVIYGEHVHTSFDKRLTVTSRITHNFHEINPDSHYAGSLSNWQRGYFYGYAHANKIEEQVQFQSSEKLTLTGGLSYESIISLPRTGLMHKPLAKSQALDNQDLRYIGATGYDVHLDPTDTPEPIDSLAITQQFYLNKYYNLGGFGQAQWTPSRKFEATVGFRVDNNSRYGSSINPRLGLVWKPIRSLTIKSLYGEAFLAPSPDKAYSQAGTLEYAGEDTEDPSIRLVSYYHFANPDLKPEKLKTAEVSFTWFVFKDLSIQGNIFKTTISNAIDLYADTPQDFTPEGNIRAIREEMSRNVGSINISGASIVINHLLTWKSNRLNSYVGWAQTDGENDFEGGVATANRLFYQAKNTVKGGVDLITRRVGISARALFRGRSYTARKDWEYYTFRNYANYNGVYYSNEAYTQVNVNGYYRFIDTSKVSLYLSGKVTNALNAKYYNVYVGGEEGFSKTPQDPIRFNFGLTVEVK